MPTALITGASRGLGRGFAERFAEEGHDVALVARSEDDLQAVADGVEDDHGVATHVVPTDLTDHGEREALIAALDDRGVTVDALVNNAGFGNSGRFHEIPLEHDRDLLELNAGAVQHLTKHYLDAMLDRGERGDGQILNVASTAGFWPGPGMATYFASKSYALLLTEAVADEVASSGVDVTALCPGPVRTAFWEEADMEDARLSSFAAQDVETVVDRGYRGLQRGDRVVVPSWTFKLLRFSSRFAPRFLQRKIAATLNSEH